MLKKLFHKLSFISICFVVFFISACNSDIKPDVEIINAKEPVIESQPCDIKAIIPASGNFTIGAFSPDGGSLTYQWYQVCSEGESDILIEGETDKKLSLSFEEAGTTKYYCEIKNTIPDNGDGGTKTASIKTETVSFEAVYLKDAISSYTITETPVTLHIANPKASFSFGVSIPGYNVKYQWYESSDGSTNTGSLITATEANGADTTTFTTPDFTEKGIHYYYCSARIVIYEGNESNPAIELELVKSPVVSVAFTGLPTVIVNTKDKQDIISKEDWMKKTELSITGAENEDWNIELSDVSIKGRGNSTWGQPKKPYAIKLDKKKNLLGMPAHKRWVLIANYLDNSFLRNEMAFYLSEQFELDYTVQGKFVDLILNGEYKGLYWLGEAIKVDENRININDGNKRISDDEDKDYLIEMDVYFDEPVKFHSSIRNMPYMIKNDDYMIDDDGTLTTGGQARLNRLQEKITNIENLLYPDYSQTMNVNDCSAPDENYSDIIDIDSWAKFYLVNEIMSNGELGHPKSCYFTYENATTSEEHDSFKAGPVWDFDWASLYVSNSCSLKGTIYYNALFKSPSFKQRLKEIWSAKHEGIDISSKIENMRSQIQIAADFDTKLWGVNHNPITEQLSFSNFNGHVDFLKNALQSKYAVVESEVNGF